eukprot:GILI01004064.1.p2 GENE.GILI01004064.1~~GILI01004064.1.p2  ORF type:complete len:148 (+),score=50.23 GILI01004064.1:60-503(+)
MAEEGDVPVQTDVDAIAAVAVEEGPLEPMEALRRVLKTSLIHDGLARGLRECTRALDRRQAQFCVLAQGITEPGLPKLITALCHEANIPLIKVDSAKDLGEWAGLYKLDATGTPRKVVKCSCVVVREYGLVTPAKEVLDEYIRANSA